MEQDKLVRAIKWSVLYLIGYGALTVTGNFIFPDWLLAVCGLTGAAYILIHAFFMKYKRERLFISGLISALAVLCLGILAGKRLDLEGVLALGAAISVIDILSFTRYGKRTKTTKAFRERSSRSCVSLRST